MDRTTAHDTIRDHQPSRWWILIGRNRCRSCRRPWPCGFWHNAVAIRDRTADHAAIARMTDLFGQLRLEALNAIAPPNQNRAS